MKRGKALHAKPKQRFPHISRKNLLFSAQVGSIGGDDLLVPVEGILAQPAVVAGAVIVLVDVDEAVALGHLACGGRDQAICSICWRR